MSCCPMPGRSYPCLCNGEGAGRGASISRQCWLAGSPGEGGVPVVDDGLKSIRKSVQQVGRSRAERAEDVQGAFVVPANHRAGILGRRLILVDDVLTSGATVDACTRALLRAGASHVDVLVCARVVAP